MAFAETLTHSHTHSHTLARTGADPKSVVCAFFKSGACGKGAKCKFSHDLAVERKSEKKSIYSDERKEEDSMANWDEAKLNEVRRAVVFVSVSVCVCVYVCICGFVVCCGV